MIKTLIRVVFASHHPDTEMRLSCLFDASSRSTGESERDGSRVKRLQRNYNRWRLCYFHQFNEMVKPRYATPASITPVEAISPPL